MSLVNDMLNDLEQRQRKSADTPHLEVAAVGSSEKTTQMPSKWLIGLLLLIVAAITVSIFLPKNVPPQSVMTARTLSPINDSDANLGERDGAAVTAMAPTLMQNQSGVLRISSELKGEQYILIVSATVLDYEINANNEKELVLIFKNASLPAERLQLPEWISAIDKSQQGSVARIMLEGRKALYYQTERSTNADGQELLIVITPDSSHLIKEKHGLQTEKNNVAVDRSLATEKKVTTENKTSVRKAAATEPQQDKSARRAPVDATALKRKVPVDSVKTPVPLTPEQLDKKASLEAQQLIRKGDYRAAEQQLWRMVDGYVDARESQVALITLLLAQQRYPQAQQLLMHALSRQPDERRFLKLKSRYLLATGDPSAALVVLEAMRVNLQVDVEHVELMAAAQQQTANHQQAIQLYQQLLRHDGNQAGWWVGFAVSLEALGQIDSARAAYRRATQLPFENVSLQQYVQQRLNVLASEQAPTINR